MKYIIGIDAGATKSELVAYDLECNPIYKDIGGYGNPSVNLNKTMDNLCSLIDKSLKELKEYQCIFMAIGMAGVDRGNIKNTIKEYIDRRYSIENIVLNDAKMAAMAYLGMDDGILTIAGTGSSCYVQKDKTGQIIGGWGHILGDEGSAYHTVIEAFKKITYKIDKDIPLDDLSLGLIKAVEDLNYEDIKSFIYRNEKIDIANLFPVIVQLADQGNMEAIKLLEKAGEHLANMAITAYRRYEFDKDIKIGLKGGVFYHSKDVLSSFKKIISKNIKNYTIICEDISATKAVCNFYKTRG